MAEVNNREVNTGNLEVDGSTLRIQVQHGHSITPPREWGQVIASTKGEGGYSNIRELTRTSATSDMGLIAKEISNAIKRKHEVTVPNLFGVTKFVKIGPIVVGKSPDETGVTRRVSVGRFGLKSALGLWREPQRGIGHLRQDR